MVVGTEPGMRNDCDDDSIGDGGSRACDAVGVKLGSDVGRDGNGDNADVDDDNVDDDGVGTGKRDDADRECDG